MVVALTLESTFGVGGGVDGGNSSGSCSGRYDGEFESMLVLVATVAMLML